MFRFPIIHARYKQFSVFARQPQEREMVPQTTLCFPGIRFHPQRAVVLTCAAARPRRCRRLLLAQVTSDALEAPK